MATRLSNIAARGHKDFVSPCDGPLEPPKNPPASNNTVAGHLIRAQLRTFSAICRAALPGTSSIIVADPPDQGWHD